MPLAAGSSIGPFDIVGLIGTGGMGEVYRARDRKLHRDIALKILPEPFATDAERLTRFQREARALAALNHPHIAQIHGVEESNGARALVMELVEGETLADRIARGALPVSETVAVAEQIADALDAAHERGIVHRDLKPANIKLRPDGTVKVLDFGLAKAFDRRRHDEAAQSPTMTAAGTRAGVILGTAAYMSPEQARGLPVDKRTDIWAFGCVLYEMLTGRAAFAGDTVSDIVARVLEREPVWDALPASTPPVLRRMARMCLAKDPRRRVRDIGDVRLELDDMLASGVRGDAFVGGTASCRGSRWILAVAGVTAGIGIGALIWALQARPNDTVQRVTRTTVTMPADQQLDTDNMAAPLALSPDGRRLVYVAHSAGQAQLYVRGLDAFVATPIAGTDGARYPFFSPDGEWVGFFSQGKLKRVSIRGGSPLIICDAPVVGRGATWAPDGTIVFDPGASGLMRVSASGGTPEPVKSRDAAITGSNLSWPHFLPNGRVVLATAGIGFNSRLLALSLDTGEWRDLGEGFQVQYVQPGIPAVPRAFRPGRRDSPRAFRRDGTGNPWRRGRGAQRRVSLQQRGGAPISPYPGAGP